MQYDFRQIETRWQETWDRDYTFRTPNPGDDDFDASRPKYYVLDMFPYPSGVGLHVGHPLGYIATDIIARYRRMCGFNVLHPMGYDAFGLPAEQYAVEHNVHPRITTENNIQNMTRQLRRLGLSYDWDRCLSTTDPAYYRWTQWIFLQMYNAWLDPNQNRARPIRELMQMLESGEMDVGLEDDLIPVAASGAMDALGGTAIGARKWHELAPDQQRNVLDNHRLAYLDEVPVNWCPALGTVLANEEVTNEGLSERGNHPVFKRPLMQWMLRITAYAERLIEDLEQLDWPEPVKLMQRNWIGRSAGAMVDFSVESTDDVIRVFTTRPDTLFGATYMVLAPEHPLVDVITAEGQRESVRRYQQDSNAKSETDRQSETATGEKIGVFTGAFAINPTSGERIPIWIADYVLMGYGTGAIMAVPAHDQRDFEFAQQFNLIIRAVVMPDDQWLQHAVGKPEAVSDSTSMEPIRKSYQQDPAAFPEAFTGEGVNINSQNPHVSLDGKHTTEAKETITRWLESEELGQYQVQYKLRDWLFSRQRYWGEPFPILHGPDGDVVALDETKLPVELPELDDFKPQVDSDPGAPPQPPLSRSPESWKSVKDNGVTYSREFNTMPQWAGSCWYYLRFLDPNNEQVFADKKIESYWMGRSDSAVAPPNGGVDLYVGGVEHAVLHLLYARFWHKVLFDLGHVSTPEPFGKLYNQGYIQAHAYTDQRGIYVPADEVEERDGVFYYQDEVVHEEFGKMGKSLKNAIAPDNICEQYGCDTLRLYEMYLGPLDQSKIWRTRDILGVHRFLQRLWRNFVDEEGGQMLIDESPPDEALNRALHKTLKRVTIAMENFAFNVAIAALIELNNKLVGRQTIPRDVAETMVLALSPMAPHICEQLWQMMGKEQTLAYEPWPQFDPALLVEEQIELPIQVNGKLRSRITVDADADDKTVEETALADDKIKQALGDATVRKVIIVKGRLVNVVVAG